MRPGTSSEPLIQPPPCKTAAQTNFDILGEPFRMYFPMGKPKHHNHTPGLFFSARFLDGKVIDTERLVT